MENRCESYSVAATVAMATVKAATASAATATVATAAATVATARATTVTTAMVAIHWDGAQRVVIKTAWMMPTRKRMPKISVPVRVSVSQSCPSGHTARPLLDRLID